eukprot:CCRYP_005618-RA/>CCRYP_005618-RA protein AED:0.40 eAED:0.40 QI:0/0/0/0.5/1/1/4/0/613
MTSSIYKASDVASLVDVIETEGIDSLDSRPNCHKLVKLVNQLANGCRNIDCNYSNYGMSCIQAQITKLTRKMEGLTNTVQDPTPAQTAQPYAPYQPPTSQHRPIQERLSIQCVQPHARTWYAASLSGPKSNRATNTNNYAIVDSGASYNYLTPTATDKTKTTLHQPIQVTLPDQSTLRSSHACELDIPLPKTAKQGYVLPGMKNHSLISVTKMCDAGCKVIFSKDECNIVHNGTIIMQGHKNKRNGLWYIPIKQSITNTPFVIYNDNTNPSKHTSNNVEFELFIGATIANQNDGTIYNNQTGAFPVTSYHSNKYQFVTYEYRNNAILVRALTDQTDKSLIAVFRDVYEYLTDCGFQPKLNVMDNQCSTKAAIQLVNPDNHRVNAAERAIQTWKEHWLSSMGTLDPTCPIQLWCQFIEQGKGTLNLLRVSHVNPKLSAYAVLEGQFSFDKTPPAPVGTRALILLDPSARKTWQNHALDAWYVDPAKNHYRNYRFFIPSTKGYRISGSAKFFPKHTKMPAIKPGDTKRLAAQDLIAAIRTVSNAPITLTSQHTAALQQLADIFATCTQVDNDTVAQHPPPLPRVRNPPPATRVTRMNNKPSTSTNPVDPERLQTQ